MKTLKSIFPVMALAAFGLLGYGGSKLWRHFGQSQQVAAVLVTNNPFFVQTSETVTLPDGSTKPSMNYIEARSSNGTRYSFAESPISKLNELTIFTPDGVIIKAVPALRIKTTLKLTTAEDQEQRRSKPDPVQRCGSSFSGSMYPGKIEGFDKLGHRDVVKVSQGAPVQGQAYEVQWVSPEFDCVELKRHTEYRDRAGEYTETNRTLTSADFVEPGQNFVSMADGYEEVGPLERRKRMADFVGLTMGHKEIQVFTARDEDYKKRKR